MNGLFFFNLLCTLNRTDSLNRTNISTSATVNAFIGIDFIDIALGNRFRWTFRQTSPTSSAFITNYISHNIKFLSYTDKYKPLGQMKK